MAMTIGEVFAGVALKADAAAGLAALTVKGLDYDSRRVGEGFLFFAFAGQQADGRVRAPMRCGGARSRW